MHWGQYALIYPWSDDGEGAAYTVAVHNELRYTPGVIRSFRSEETAKVWRGRSSRRLPPDIQRVARRKLRMLNNAKSLADLRVPPANRLEALRGDRAGQYSIRVNDRWRVCFEWRDGDAFEVEVVDYHG